MIPRKTAVDAARILLSEIRVMLSTAATQTSEEGRRDAWRSIRDRLRNACTAQARMNIDHDHEDIYHCIFDACNHITSVLALPVFPDADRRIIAALDCLRNLRAIVGLASTNAVKADASCAEIGGAV